MELNNFFKYNPNLLKSILLLVLAVSGNFVGNTLGCKTQYHMTNNMYVKHALLIFITFFTLNYTASENENPSMQILRAFIIWVCYLLFTKQNITFTGLSAGILILTYVIDTFSSYYTKISEDKELGEKVKKENKEKADTLNKFKNYSFKAGILTIIIGFSLYFREKYTEYGNDFNILTFIFGKTTCKSLN
jgi:hypothetical protein